jgi:hypothetical protein
VKKLAALTQGKAGVESLLEAKLGPKTATDGPSAQLRRFYTNNYSALDRFDRLWYEMRFFIRPRDWETHFCWSLLHSAVINARAAWCAAHGERVPLKQFLSRLVAKFAETLAD